MCIILYSRNPLRCPIYTSNSQCSKPKSSPQNEFLFLGSPSQWQCHCLPCPWVSPLTSLATNIHSTMTSCQFYLLNDLPLFSLPVATTLAQALTVSSLQLCHSLLRDLQSSFSASLYILRPLSKGQIDSCWNPLGLLSILKIKSVLYCGTQALSGLTPTCFSSLGSCLSAPYPLLPPSPCSPPRHSTCTSLNDCTLAPGSLHYGSLCLRHYCTVFG